MRYEGCLRLPMRDNLILSITTSEWGVGDQLPEELRDLWAAAGADLLHYLLGFLELFEYAVYVCRLGAAAQSDAAAAAAVDHVRLVTLRKCHGCDDRFGVLEEVLVHVGDIELFLDL